MRVLDESRAPPCMHPSRPGGPRRPLDPDTRPDPVAHDARPRSSRQAHRRRSLVWATLIGLAVSLLAGCLQQPPSALARIRKRGELRVVTLNLPTCYYLGAQGPEGLEFQLAREFASQLGVTLVIYPVANERALQTELARGRADVAAAQISADEAWRRVGLPARPYTHVAQLVVYRRDGERPRGTMQFAGAKLAVRAGSPQEHLLEHLRRLEPQLKWIETAPSSADPLEDVDSGDADYAIVDAREYSFARHLYPDVQVGFALPDERDIQWVVRRGGEDLLEAVERFFHGVDASGHLAQLVERASGDTREFAYQESVGFQAHLAERLPRYRALFQQAAARSGFDWRLLAAIGYQESKWDPAAQSEYGASGVMMLTADTADAMGIQDRRDPAQNIDAGARYLASVRDKVPARIPEPDRTWFVVASYNVGFGHLEDARRLTQSLGGNPDSWAEVRRQLPRLAEERYFSRARRGYARGWEPVQFVDRVQRYLTLLEWQPGQGVIRDATRVGPAAAPAAVQMPGQATPGAPAPIPAPATRAR